jgi:hypothetical protein
MVTRPNKPPTDLQTPTGGPVQLLREGKVVDKLLAGSTPVNREGQKQGKMDTPR